MRLIRCPRALLWLALWLMLGGLALAQLPLPVQAANGLTLSTLAYLPAASFHITDESYPDRVSEMNAIANGQEQVTQAVVGYVASHRGYRRYLPLLLR